MIPRLAFVVFLIMSFSGTSFAEHTRPSQREVEGFLSKAIAPLRSCLVRSLPRPPQPAVVVVMEFDPAGGFPMPMEIEAAPGSALERCVGEALAELSAPPIPGPLLRVQCRFPLVNSTQVVCRPAPVAAPPPQPSSPPPSNPPARSVSSAGAGPNAAPPAAPLVPAQPQAPLSRQEVSTAMQTLRPSILQCTGAANPPPTLRLRIQIDGQGHITLLEALPMPPATVSNCLAHAVSSVRLRATGGDNLTVLYPFTLR